MRFTQAASGHWIPVDEDKHAAAQNRRFGATEGFREESLPIRRKANQKQAEEPRRKASGAALSPEGVVGDGKTTPGPAGGGADEGAGDV